MENYKNPLYPVFDNQILVKCHLQVVHVTDGLIEKKIKRQNAKMLPLRSADYQLIVMAAFWTEGKGTVFSAFNVFMYLIGKDTVCIDRLVLPNISLHSRR